MPFDFKRKKEEKILKLGSFKYCVWLPLHYVRVHVRACVFSLLVCSFLLMQYDFRDAAGLRKGVAMVSFYHLWCGSKFIKLIDSSQNYPKEGGKTYVTKSFPVWQSTWHIETKRLDVARHHSDLVNCIKFWGRLFSLLCWFLDGATCTPPIFFASVTSSNHQFY